MAELGINQSSIEIYTEEQTMVIFSYGKVQEEDMRILKGGTWYGLQSLITEYLSDQSAR